MTSNRPSLFERAKPAPQRAPQRMGVQRARPRGSIATGSPAKRRKRFASLLALIAVPAMAAAPGDFGALAGNAPSDPVARGVSEGRRGAMAFEQPGMSFPGSAFYYLADPPKAALIALPESDPASRSAQGARAPGTLIDAGPAARPFVAGSGANYARAEDCLAQAVWYEAASESEAGQRAVAQVVLNRVAHPSWPGSVCGVVYQGSQRSTGCQFSFTCDGSLARRKPESLNGASWNRARRVARGALAGDVYTPIGHATHYHTLWVKPYWARALDHVGTIGAHRFYRNRGSGGTKTAFSARYSGNEPLVSARRAAIARSLEPSALAKDGDRMANAPGARLSITAQPSSEAASPVRAEPTGGALADPALESAGKPRDAYTRAGRWKVDPSALDLGASGRSQANTGDPPRP
ncbi:MAG: cell wall hydrolase [Erythrobacter sp.]|uniref:cell wall hydrolase n=1 Tax=Erythrobacter sp. TaxID=1042 RepID=UPI002633A335|nr:cell wall hydrolase [Erythrobacter sp.]MDJ0978052.1 cell wall hydrolase [Erythrobacter sp.]